MKKEVTFNVFKACGHTMGTWKGDPVNAPAKTKGEVYEVNDEEIQTNEEEPMLPPVLGDDTDKKKVVTDDNGPEILMPTSI